MKVRISALGALKKYLPSEKDFEIEENDVNLKKLITNYIGIPSTESRISFIVNGRIQKDSYQPLSDDKIVVLKMGGAG